MIRRLFFTLAMIASLFSIALSQENPKPRGQQKPTETPAEKKEAAPQEAQNEALRLAIQSLSNQIALLNSELKTLRAQSERNAIILELLLNEERLTRLEEKIEDYQHSWNAKEEARVVWFL